MDPFCRYIVLVQINVVIMDNELTLMNLLGIIGSFPRVPILLKKLRDSAIGLVWYERDIAQAVAPADNLVGTVGAGRYFRLQPPLAIIPICLILFLELINVTSADGIILPQGTPHLQKFLLVEEAGRL